MIAQEQAAGIALLAGALGLAQFLAQLLGRMIDRSSAARSGSVPEADREFVRIQLDRLVDGLRSSDSDQRAILHAIREEAKGCGRTLEDLLAVARSIERGCLYVPPTGDAPGRPRRIP